MIITLICMNSWLMQFLLIELSVMGMLEMNDSCNNSHFKKVMESLDYLLQCFLTWK